MVAATDAQTIQFIFSAVASSPRRHSNILPANRHRMRKTSHGHIDNEFLLNKSIENMNIRVAAGDET